MTLYFLRHGETDYNLEKRIQGWSDVPLNDLGIFQAEEVGEKIRANGIEFDKVFSSPLRRAIRTAEVVTGLDRTDIKVDQRLIEMGFGKYEGRRLKHIPEDVFDLILNTEKIEESGFSEGPNDVLERTKSFLEQMKSIDSKSNVLCVSHGVTIRAMISNLNGDGKSIPWDAKVGNCALFMTELQNGSYTPPRQIL